MHDISYEILMIFSRMEDYQTNRELLLNINNSSHSYYKISYIVDPKRSELELLVQQNKYLCIIPCTQFTVYKQYGNKYKLNNYMVSQLLENLNLNFWGCGYISSLILHEKNICSYMPLGVEKPQIISRYNYTNNNLLNKSAKYKFPIILEPVYTNNYFSKKNHCVDSFEELQVIISMLFKEDSDLEELQLRNKITSTKNIVVTIIGNPPLAITFICEFDLELITGKAVSDNHKYTKLISNSYRIFKEYEFRDFGEFIYSFDVEKDNYFLTHINTTNCLASTVIIAFEQCCSINNIINIFDVFLLVYLIRIKNVDENIEIIKNILFSLPQNIREEIIPFDITKKIFPGYNYKMICDELKNRFLQSDEGNSYEIVQYIKNCMENIPIPQTSKAVYLGNSDTKYDFLSKYESIPECPQDPYKILVDSLQIMNGQMRWHAPSMLYNVNPPVMFNTVAATTISKMYNPNAINKRTSSGFLEMERQIVRQFANLLGWNKDTSAGIFTPGGKYCLTYAIKCGLNRCKYETKKFPVVITSEINHYSIESVCEQLGIGKRCIRISLTEEGTIDFDVFSQTLKECFIRNIPIACIIFSGGNTTHSNVEDIKKGYCILHTMLKQFNITYVPYIYYDLVVCWPWLFFKYYNFTMNRLKINNIVLSKIEKTLKKLAFTYLADGIGVDFHKGGFAPYTCSTFLNKNSNELYSIFNLDTLNSKIIEPNQYSLGNSRNVSDIISAWNIMQSVGIEGFQAYIANMLTVSKIFSDNLVNYGFVILEENYTYSFATLIWASYPQSELNYDMFICSAEEIIIKNNKYLYALSQYWIQNSEHSYYARFLPNYMTFSNKKIAVISLLPMTFNIDDDEARKMVVRMGRLKKEFDQKYISGIKISFDKMPENVEK